MDLTPTTLEGTHVRLEPLTPAHAGDLLELALDPDLWRFTTTAIGSRAELDDYIATALDWQRRGTALPFATIHRTSGRAIGSTRFANIDREHRRAEIGWTWVGRPYQRTAVNTEAKLLMLAHAFERMECVRVELKTDALNARSRAAILRLGATEEGVLRHHMVVRGGRLRDTVYYSILRDEWPRARAGLEAKLREHEGEGSGR
ncbi:MAG TPA: GNAT family protein [Gemmatimonadaceae bacterium]|nr:GNAT family protein [Gemmatimonadaceae bacterium]